MNRILLIILLGCAGIILVLFLRIDVKEGSEYGKSINHRPKRYLAFQNGSRFFVRMNFKANIVPWNQIFAQAIGFRMNYDDPPSTFRFYHKMNRRSLYENMESILNRNGLNGEHCIRRAICEVGNIEKAKGIYEKIMKIIFRRLSTGTDKWEGPASTECELSTTHCPFSFLDVALYTDT